MYIALYSLEKSVESRCFAFCMKLLGEKDVFETHISITAFFLLFLFLLFLFISFFLKLVSLQNIEKRDQAKVHRTVLPLHMRPREYCKGLVPSRSNFLNISLICALLMLSIGLVCESFVNINSLEVPTVTLSVGCDFNSLVSPLPKIQNPATRHVDIDEIRGIEGDLA